MAAHIESAACIAQPDTTNLEIKILQKGAVVVVVVVVVMILFLYSSIRAVD